jgi:hypothetical protein
MATKIFCQSCTMPIDNLADRGTEKDGNLSSEFCKYCYQHGELINPEMTLDEMKALVVSQMKKMHLPESIIQNSVDMLPNLKRWRKEPVAAK